MYKFPPLGKFLKKKRTYTLWIARKNEQHYYRSKVSASVIETFRLKLLLKKTVLLQILFNA